MGGAGREEKLSQKHFMSFIFNCESVVTDTIAEEASLPFTVSGSKGHECPHGFWLQHRPRTSSRLQVAAQTMDIPMVFGGIKDHGHQHAPTPPPHPPHWQHSPRTPMWLQAAAQTSDIHLAFSGNSGKWQFLKG